MAYNPIVVAPLSDEPQVFDILKDPRLRLLQPGAAGSATPDIFVYPCAKLIALQPDDPAIDPAMWRLLREGRARLVLDSSTEGRPHTSQFSEAAHRALAGAGVPARQVTYLTQNRLYAADYTQWAKRQGLKDRVRIEQYDYYVRNFLVPYEAADERTLWRREKAFRRRAADRPRTFICLNRTLRVTKLAFLARVMRDGLWDEGHISVGGFSKSMAKHKVTGRMARIAPFSDLASEIEPFLDAIEAHATPEAGVDFTRKVSDSLIAEHAQSYFTVVTETEMESRPIRITEKSLKPLANYHPFLIVGNPGALEILKGMGFRSFAGAIDEAYDAESDPRARFELVYAEFRRLCGLGRSALCQLERDVVDVLRHNARRLILELPALHAGTLDRRLVDTLIPVLETQP